VSEAHPVPAPLRALDRWVTGRFALVAAFAWGLAEATCFFVVPDVLLSLIAARRLRPALHASLAALAGALLGGAIMVAFGAWAPAATRTFLDHVPAIGPSMIATAQTALDRRGAWATMTGPLGGIPYKIYAVEWGARHGALGTFLLVSIPARYLRFLLSVLLARGIAASVEDWTRRPAVVVALWVAFWIGLYAMYWSHVPR
jgi:membrane protein YqaA with SNARE-associated domain